MPIYSYKCSQCGFAKDVLQKLSDAPLRECPACGQPAMEKQVTAAGFQLKGSGWYVTDFRGGSGSKNDAADASKDAPKDDAPKDAAHDAPKAATKDSAPAAAAAASASTAAPAAPAAG